MPKSQSQRAAFLAEPPPCADGVPTDGAAALREGNEALAKGAFDEAEARFLTALFLDPSSDTALRGYWSAQAHEKHIERSKRVHLQVTREDRDRVDGWLESAITDYRAGHFDACLATLTRALHTRLGNDSQYLADASEILRRVKCAKKK